MVIAVDPLPPAVGNAAVNRPTTFGRVMVSHRLFNCERGEEKKGCFSV